MHRGSGGSSGNSAGSHRVRRCLSCRIALRNCARLELAENWATGFVDGFGKNRQPRSTESQTGASGNRTTLLPSFWRGVMKMQSFNYGWMSAIAASPAARSALTPAALPELLVARSSAGWLANAIENSANKKNGVEITVKLDNGQVITVAQGADPMHGPLSSARTCA